MRKRFWALFVSVLVVMAMTSSFAAAQQTTIEFVYWAGTGEDEAFETLIAKFEEENPDIKVNAQHQPFGENFHTQIQMRIAAGTAPDVFRVQYSRLGTYTSDDALLDVTDLFHDIKDSFAPSLYAATLKNGRMYAVPHHTDTSAVFYNKTYLDELGIVAPDNIEDAWTWEEFLDVAKRLQESGLATHGVAYNWDHARAWRALPFFYHNSDKMFSDDLRQARFDSPEAIETFAFLQDLFKNYMSQGNSMRGSDDFNLLFTTGHAGMLITGNWMIPRWEQEMHDYEWGVTFMPVQKHAASDMGGNALAIPRNAKNQEAAKRFLRFMAEKENNKIFAEIGLFLPSRIDIEESFDFAIENPELMDLFMDQALTVPTEMAAAFALPAFAEITGALGDALEELFMLNGNPEKVAKNMNATVNRILSR